MRGGLASLAEWLRLPVWGGLDELDMQINKLRMLRYPDPSQFTDSRSDRIADVNRDRKQLPGE
jgi:hypothetical protein